MIHQKISAIRNITFKLVKTFTMAFYHSAENTPQQVFTLHDEDQARQISLHDEYVGKFNTLLEILDSTDDCFSNTEFHVLGVKEYTAMDNKDSLEGKVVKTQWKFASHTSKYEYTLTHTISGEINLKGINTRFPRQLSELKSIGNNS